MFCVGSLLSSQKSSRNRPNIISIEGNKKCTAVPARKRTVPTSFGAVVYTIPDNLRTKQYQENIPLLHTKKKKEMKGERKRQQKKNETTSMRSGHRPSPARTGLLFAGTISCPAVGPTDGRHAKARQEDKKRNKGLAQNAKVLCPAGGRRTTQKGQTKKTKETETEGRKKAVQKPYEVYQRTASSCRSECCASAQPYIIPKRTD